MEHPHPSVPDDWHYDLTLGISIASNVPRKLLHIGDKNSLFTFSGCTADSFSKLDQLASNLALEGTQNELILSFCIGNIETRPINSIAWRPKRMIGVP